MSARPAEHVYQPVVVDSRLYDPVVVLVAGMLMTLGVAMVCSASATVQGAPFDLAHWWQTPLRQGVFAVAGFVAMLIGAHVNYRVLAWERPGAGWRAGLLLLITIACQAAVLVPGIGKSVLGARRAIYIPGLAFGFQPSELAKVVLVVWIAALLTRPAARRRRDSDRIREIDPSTNLAHAAAMSSHQAKRRRPPRPTFIHEYERVDVGSFWRGYVPTLLTGGIVFGLTAKEDFGTAALMGAVLIIMLFCARARLTHLGLTALLGVVAAVGLVVIEPYRMARIKTYMDAAPDPQGAGYQINQALLAIGSGGWWGRGLGNGVQKYGYLPQDNNDFILAIICEELGVAGGIAVAVLFLILLLRGWRIAANAPDRFGQLVAIGLTLIICLQAAFNIGVVTHSVPTKGISLPFVSAGGSGVVFLGLAAGLLASIGRRTVVMER